MLDLSGICNWSSATRIETRFGIKFLRKANVSPEFWDVWKKHKDELKSQGISVKKIDNIWHVEWWSDKFIDLMKDVKDKICEKTIESSMSTNSNIKVPCPKNLEFYPYQKAGIEFSISRSNTLIADEMGLGKTPQAIGVINCDDSIKKILIICPASLKINWNRELDKWLVRKYKISIVNGKNWENGDIIIINYDILKNFKEKLKNIKWDLFILDEAHFCKSRKSIRSKIALSIKSKRKLFLTGTPIVNRPSELFPIIKSLDNKTWKNYTDFAERYCNRHFNGFGWDDSGARRLDELQALLRSSIMIRRLKKDVLKELPDKFRQIIEISSRGLEKLIEKEKSLFKKCEELKKNLNKISDKSEITETTDQLAEAISPLKEQSVAFAELTKVRKDVAIAKVPYVIEYVKDILIDNDNKLILFAYHTDVVDLLMKNLQQFNPVKVVGGVSQTNRQKAVDSFQNDKTTRLFIGNIQAAGTGITLTASSHVLFSELDWVPANMCQAEDRAHRIGQKNSVLVQHLVLENSLDANIAKTLIQKQKILEEALNKK